MKKTSEKTSEKHYIVNEEKGQVQVKQVSRRDILQLHIENKACVRSKGYKPYVIVIEQDVHLKPICSWAFHRTLLNNSNASWPHELLRTIWRQNASYLRAAKRGYVSWEEFTENGGDSVLCDSFQKPIENEVSVNGLEKAVGDYVNSLKSETERKLVKQVILQKMSIKEFARKIENPSINETAHEARLYRLQKKLLIGLRNAITRYDAELIGRKEAAEARESGALDSKRKAAEQRKVATEAMKQQAQQLHQTNK